MALVSDQDPFPFALSRRERQPLEGVLATTADAQQRRRAEALLGLAARESVPAIAARLHVSRQTVYNWVRRFRQREGIAEERLADGARSGRPATVAGLIDPIIDVLIDQDPGTFGYAATVWTAPLLRRHLDTQHGVTASEQSVRLAIDRLCLRWKRPRYQLSRRSPTWRQAKGGSSGGSPDGAGRCC
jgi:transposase